MAAEEVELDGGDGGGGGGKWSLMKQSNLIEEEEEVVNVWSAGVFGGGGGTPMNPVYNGYIVAGTAGGGIGTIPGGGGTGMGLVAITCGGIDHGAPTKKSN